MDNRTKEYLHRWLVDEYFNSTPETQQRVEDAMIVKFDSNPEYWDNQTWWKLHDEAMLLGSG